MSIDFPRCQTCRAYLVRSPSGGVCPDGHGGIHSWHQVFAGDKGAEKILERRKAAERKAAAREARKILNRYVIVGLRGVYERIMPSGAIGEIYGWTELPRDSDFRRPLPARRFYGWFRRDDVTERAVVEMYHAAKLETEEVVK